MTATGRQPTRLGVDVGGTFTDLVLDDGERLRTAKVPSTRHDQSEGVATGLDRLPAGAGQLDRFAHGTTVATNAVLERDGARTVLVVTDGFRDLLEIGRQDRPHLYDLFADRPQPLVGRDLVVEAHERVDVDGQVLVGLDDPGPVVAAVAELDPEAVAICLLHSYRDDRHERVIEDAMRTELAANGHPVAVSRSSDVLPVFREYERASTTVLNAYVTPKLARYLGGLESRLRDAGMRCRVEVMRSSGGTFAAETAARRPVHTLLSGPAAGAWGAATCANVAGSPDVMAFDMGGTSTDVTPIEGGRPGTTAEGAIGNLPFAIRTTDVHTVGAGGGSIAWRDPGGSLRVGPRSAGAEPGPAAYGRGGTQPTVTDAHVVLGRLAPGAELGGTLELDADAARDAVGRLARELDVALEECAEGIIRVAEANIARALRVVSVQRGRDPRRYALLAFGGAGPLHQGPLASELGCRRVLVPPHAGVLAAIGLLAAPITAEAVRTRLVALDDADPAVLDDEWGQLQAAVEASLDDQGVPAVSVIRSADCRYRGQAYELEVDVGPGDDLEGLAAAFHALHDERYGFTQPEEPVEIVNLRVRAEGPAPEVPLRAIRDGEGAEAAQVGERSVRIDGQRHVCPVYARDRLGAGDRFSGPAVVTDVDMTCLVVPAQTATVDPRGNLLLEGHSG